MLQYTAWEEPQTSVFDMLAPLMQDHLSALQSGHQAQVQQECRTTRPQRPTHPVGGHRDERSTCTKRTIKGDIIKIGTTDVVIQGNNEGPMIFGNSAKIGKEEDTGAASKTSNPKYFMPQWCPLGLSRSQKRKLQRREQSKRGGKYI
jgi:hypothetical protein